MRKFSVTLPITGIAVIEVEAEDEEDAIYKALNTGVSFDDIQEWDVIEQIVRGNVFYGVQNEAEAEEVD